MENLIEFWQAGVIGRCLLERVLTERSFLSSTKSVQIPIRFVNRFTDGVTRLRDKTECLSDGFFQKPLHGSIQVAYPYRFEQSGDRTDRFQGFVVVLIGCLNDRGIDVFASIANVL